MRNSLLNLRKLRHVVVLARHGSYTRAARELNLTASALSRSIQAIEAEMNLPLFVRGKAGVFATPAGARVIGAASTLLDSAAALQRSLDHLGEMPLGNLALGMGPLPASILLPSLFATTLARREMRLQVDIQSGVRLLERLSAGEIEFFICAESAVGRMPHVSCEVMARLPLVALVRDGHPLAGARQVEAHEFYAYPMIGGAFIPDKSLYQSHEIDPRYEPFIACDDYHLLASAVKQSDAVCLFSAHFETEGLTRVDVEPGVFAKELPIVRCQLRSGRLSEAAVRALAELKSIASKLEAV